MKKIFICIIIFLLLMNSNFFIVAQNVVNDEREYLTAEHLQDNQYMTNLLNELFASETYEGNNGQMYTFKRLFNRPYITQEGEEIDLAIIMKYIYEEIYTPNGTDVSDSTNNKYSLRYVGMCDVNLADDIVEALNNGQTTNYNPIMDMRIVEDFKKRNIVYFKGTYNESDNYLGTATGAYNCHSYAWYWADSNNTVWLDSPAAYYSDNDCSYKLLEPSEEPRKGDIVVYMINNLPNHSGIIYDYSGDTTSDTMGDANKYIVDSKWGFEGLYRHRGDYCPYYDSATSIVYYRLKTDDQVSVTTSNSFDLVDKALQARTTASSKELAVYACEMNVLNNGGTHTITVRADYPLNTTLWDVNRNNYAVTYSESVVNGEYIYTYTGLFAQGIYYIRAGFVDENQSGNIDVSISQHQHTYTYTPYSATMHKTECACGYCTYQTHVVRNDSSVGRYKPCAYCGHIIDTMGGTNFPIIKDNFDNTETE